MILQTNTANRLKMQYVKDSQVLWKTSNQD